MSSARGLLLATLCSFGVAPAQTPFPSKPVRLIVTSPPGAVQLTIAVSLKEQSL